MIGAFDPFTFKVITDIYVPMVKHLSTMRETQVPSLGWEDPLEKEMATHSSILAWRIPWTEEPGELQSIRLQRVRTTERISTAVGSAVKNLPANAGEEGLILGSGRSLGEGNGNPIQYSCLEHPVDRGAWLATVPGVTKESDMT